MTTARRSRHGPQANTLDADAGWRLLVENLPDSVMLVDREGAILLANRAPDPGGREAGSGDSVYDCLPEGCREHFRESLAAAFETGQPQYEEVAETDPGGQSGRLARRIQPVLRGGRVVNAIIITTDITRYQAAAPSDPGEQRSGESRRLASIADLAAGISHEINNPLAVVQGYAEVMLDSPLPENARYQLENIHAAAKRAARIVKDLNQLARHAEPTRMPVNVKALVGQAIDLKKQEFAAGNIRFTTEFPADLPLVLADPYQLMEALLNILTNAQYAVQRAQPVGEVCARARVVGRQVRVSISDNGPGIAPENLSRVFDAFFTTQATGHGPGLGLSISYAMIHQNGGELWAESAPGSGATFHVQLPIHRPD